MIVYNVTVKINNEVHDEWLQWMKEIHIPNVMDTGLFESYQMARVLLQDESDGITYATQYHCPDMKTLQLYTAKHAPRLQKEVVDKYADKFVAFRTLLEIVE
jgi:hypothetical protein